MYIIVNQNNDISDGTNTEYSFTPLEFANTILLKNHTRNVNTGRVLINQVANNISVKKFIGVRGFDRHNKIKDEHSRRKNSKTKAQFRPRSVHRSRVSDSNNVFDREKSKTRRQCGRSLGVINAEHKDSPTTLMRNKRTGGRSRFEPGRENITYYANS